MLLLLDIEHDVSFPVFMGSAIACYCGVSLGLMYLWGSATPVRIGFHIFSYVFLGLAAIVQVGNSDFPIPGFTSDDMVASAAAAAILGVIVWDLFYWLGAMRKVAATAPSYHGVNNARFKKFLGFAVLMAALYAAVVGSGLFDSREAMADAMRGTFGSDSPFGLIFASVGQLAVAIALLGLFEAKRRDRAGSLLVAVFLVATFCVVNFISSPRFLFGSVGLAVLLGVGSGIGTPRRMRIWISAWLVGLFILFPVADSFRESSDSGLKPLDAVSAQLSSSDFDSFEQVSTGVAFVNAYGPQLGRQLLGSLFFFVPRDLWPSKPNGTGSLLGDFTAGPNSNLSAPLWVEGYLDFGYVGVALLLGLAGWVSSLLDARFRWQSLSGEGGVWLIAVPLLASYQILLLRGSLIVVVGPLSVMTLCFLYITSWGTGAPAARSRLSSQR